MAMTMYGSTFFILLLISAIEFQQNSAQITEELLHVPGNGSEVLSSEYATEINLSFATDTYASQTSDEHHTTYHEPQGTLSSGSDDHTGELWIAHQIVWPWWKIIQLTAAIAGIIGNLLVMLVVFRPQKARRSTDTLLGALAIADFLTSVFLIPIPDVSNIPYTWLGGFYCKVIYTARFMWISVSASIFTLTLISVERYIAIKQPFKFRFFFSPTRTRLAIIIVWIMAFILNSFAFFVFFVDPDTQSCILQFPTANGAEVLGITSFVIVLVLPMGIMLVTQSLTALALHRQASRFKAPGNGATQSSERHLIAKGRVIKLIFVINVIFIISWGPNQSAYLAFNLGYLPFSYLYGPLDRALVVLAFFNSCANPVIYTLQYPKFRKAVRDLFSRSNTERAPIFDQPEKTPASNPESA
ncbi:trace amine-associated receptor 6-like [Lytechinus pictus]|uniref:trace amine-associated receptor 6-like n=1 Tax=Lytechinus pictus TaxID=7653 RepID=UPI0030B9E877